MAHPKGGLSPPRCCTGSEEDGLNSPRLGLSPLRCCNGHEVVKQKMGQRWHQDWAYDRECDECGATIKRREPRWRCEHHCDYDCCKNCFEKRLALVDFGARVKMDESSPGGVLLRSAIQDMTAEDNGYAKSPDKLPGNSNSLAMSISSDDASPTTPGIPEFPTSMSICDEVPAFSQARFVKGLKAECGFVIFSSAMQGSGPDGDCSSPDGSPGPDSSKSRPNSQISLPPFPPTKPQQSIEEVEPLAGSDGNIDILNVLPSGAAGLAGICAAREEILKAGGIKDIPSSPSVDACMKVMSKNSPALFAFARVLPTDQQRAACALFALCDAIDHCQSSAGLREQLKHMDHLFSKARGQGEHPSINGALDLDDAFVATLRRFPVTRKPFTDMVEGRLSKPHGVPLRFQTFDEIVMHCYCNAGAVGLAALPVLFEDVQQEDVVTAAIVLGTLLQLVNMINNLGSKYRKYDDLVVPIDLLQRHGIAESEVIANATKSSTSLIGNSRWQKLMNEFLGYLEPLQQIARKGALQLPGGGRFAVLSALKMVQRVIDTIRGPHACDNLTKRVKMFSVHTMWDLFSAALEAST